MRIADNQSVLYYGKEQDDYPRILNHPYFKDNRPAKARLSYCGVVYPQAMLRLDLHRDEFGSIAVEKATSKIYIPSLKKLEGYQIFYRIRVGDYRIGISIEGNLVTFWRFLHRKDFYKYFP